MASSGTVEFRSWQDGAEGKPILVGAIERYVYPDNESLYISSHAPHLDFPVPNPNPS